MFKLNPNTRVVLTAFTYGAAFGVLVGYVIKGWLG